MKQFQSKLALHRRAHRSVIALGFASLALACCPLLLAPVATGQGASGPRRPVIRPSVLPTNPLPEPIGNRSPYDDSTILLSRAIVGGYGTRPLWLAVGDSTELEIEEHECRVDTCAPYLASQMWLRDWGRWSVIDPSIARVHPSQSKWGTVRPLRLSRRERVMMLVALRPGRTRVRASGVHTVADSVASRIPVDSILEREILVTPPIRRLLITPRPTRMTAGDSVLFTVRVLSHSNRPIRGVPVELRWGSATSWQESRTATEPVKVSFKQVGQSRIVAVLGEHADTLHVEVVAPPRR